MLWRLYNYKKQSFKNLYVLSLVFEVSSEVKFKALDAEKVMEGVFYNSWRYPLNRLEKKGYLINYSWIVVCCCWRGMFRPHQMFPPLLCASRRKQWSGQKLVIWKKDWFSKLHSDTDSNYYPTRKDMPTGGWKRLELPHLT